MSVEKHNRIKRKGGIYFFTTRVNNKESIFTTKCLVDVLEESFMFAENEKNVKTLIRTIMPNHIHWIFKLPASIEDPVPIYQHFKRHTAKRILSILKSGKLDHEYYYIDSFDKSNLIREINSENILDSFAIIDKNSKYQVWENKPDLKLLYSPGFIRLKVNYVYENPFREPWKLVKHPKDYPLTYANWNLINEFTV